MEVMQVLHMNGGMGETSYANNSLLQRKVILMTKPIMEAAVTALFSTATTNFPASFAIADLGCSTGPNSLFVVSEIISIMIDLYSAKKHELPELQVFLNDLPGNDFNTIFSNFLPRFQEKLREQIKSKNGAWATLSCFFSGVPGSFYGRLFPRESLHLIHSSYSLMWLSQVPQGLEGNKGNIYMARSSPSKVLTAYYEQFQRDFSTFLECRGQELVVGGRMVLTLLGRRSDDPSSKECCYIWELLAAALNEMVFEGLIEEDKLDSFNIPQYTPSPKEVRKEVQKQEPFSIDCLEVSEVNWSVLNTNFDPNAVLEDGGYNMARCMRAVTEPLLVDHFGEEIIDEVFKRYKAQLTNGMSQEKTAFVNIVISVKKIASLKCKNSRMNTSHLYARSW